MTSTHLYGNPLLPFVSLTISSNQVMVYGQEHGDAEDFKGLWQDIMNRVFSITRSNNGYERLGALACIG